MNLPKEFNYFINAGIIRKIKPDFQKSEFLVEESDRTFRGLNKRLNLMGIDKDNANSIIKDCYDLMMELIKAKLFLDGYSSSGNFSHEAEVSYLKELNFSENEISFMNELRRNRNSINYYGKLFDEEYADKVVNFAKKVYPSLKKIIGGKK